MKIRGVLLLCVLSVTILFRGVVRAEEMYACITDAATGFIFKEGKWTSTTFAADKKYILRKEKVNLLLYESGTPTSISNCYFLDDVEGILCEGLIELRMNKKSGRFIAAYLIGYWADGSSEYSKEGSNTPFIAKGNCRQL